MAQLFSLGGSRISHNTHIIMKRLILTLALFTLPALAADSPLHGGALGVSGGRYVFGQIGDTVLSTFMLDTQTGRLWKYQADDKRGLVLVAITYTLADGSASLTPVDTDKELAALQRAREASESATSTAQQATEDLAEAKAKTVASLVKAGDMDGAKKIVDSIQDEALKSLVRSKVDKALKQ